MFLIVGCNGQLGNELRLHLGDRGLYVDRDELDITDAVAVKTFVAAHPELTAIVNCAAYTAVDKAEEEEALAAAINVDGPRHLSQTGLPIIHVSTDYVFDGTQCRPYTENDATCPVSAYGRTKLAGEEAVLAEARSAVIIRTAWLYSNFGANFVKTMQRLGAERETLSVVFDQVGSPCYAGDLAAAIVTILPQLLERPGMKEVYHYSNEGVCSWYDFAVEIMECSDLDCRVTPIESTAYPTPAARPHFSVLNKAKIKADFGLIIPHWKESLLLCLSKQS